MTRTGVLVRADHRGLATLTGIMARCLQPAKVLLVDMGKHSPTDCHPDQYPDRFDTVTYDELQAGSYDWHPFLDDLDWVYTAEIPYDFRLLVEAPKRGVKTLLHVMPELDPYVRQPDLPRPDVIALPTRWLASRYEGCPVLPVPAEPWTHHAGHLVVHPGSLAMKDRQGTRTVIDASELTRHHLVIRCQAAPDHPWRHARIEVDDQDDERALLHDAALVVIPRRYGGLSLTVQEAMSAGLPILLPDSDPYADQVPPEAWLPSERGRDLQAKGGNIATFNVKPQVLAECIDAVMADAGLRAYLAGASAKWADAHTWEHLKADWVAVLAA